MWSSHQLKTCHYKRGISQCSFQNLRLFISGSDSLRKSGCRGWEGVITFRGTACTLRTEQKPQSSYHKCTPTPAQLPESPSLQMTRNDQSPRESHLVDKKLFGLCTHPAWRLPLWGLFSHKSGEERRQQHLPPVRTSWLVSNQHTETTSCEYFQKSACYFL